MRLRILEAGHTRKQRAIMWLVRRYLGVIPGPIKTMSYRPELFGAPMSATIQEAMREGRCFTAPQTELMAAFVSHRNRCEY